MTGLVAEKDALAILAEARGFPLEAVEALSAVKKEPRWLTDRRRDAWRIYQETPMPRSTDEEWRRTDIRALKMNGFSAYAPPSHQGFPVEDLPLEMRPALGHEEAGLVIHDNAAAVHSWLSRDWAERGVIFTDLDSAVQEYPDIVREYLLTRCVTPADGKFEALHAALWGAGTLLYVPENVVVELPLRAIQWVDAGGAAQLGHTLVVAGSGSQLTLITEMHSSHLSEQAFSNGGTEIFVGDGASVQLINLQNWDGAVWHFAIQRALVGHGGRIDWGEATLGGQLSRTRLEVRLQGAGSSAQLQAVILPSGKQHFAYHTLQHHMAEHTTSDLLFKGVLRDSARSLFQGLIKVDPEAQRTDAYQADRNLLLSEKARADSIPTLEIEANDVRCTHGATVSQIDEDELFYAMSRGLSRRAAQRLIVEGFLESVLERFPVQAMRDRIRGMIHAKLED